MYKTISNKIIREFHPCYDPSEVITDENEELTVKQWVEKYRNVVPAKDIFWLLLREEFLSEKDLRLFAVWCVREALKLITNPDKRSVNACNVAEKFANGEVTKEELWSARITASAAYVDYAAYAADADYIAYNAAITATYYASALAATNYDSALAAAHASALAARDTVFCDDADAARATRALQLDQLLIYFE